jgi:hypothetical protein
MFVSGQSLAAAPSRAQARGLYVAVLAAVLLPRKELMLPMASFQACGGD